MVWIELGEDVRIPGTITDLDAFRRWARSDQFPEHGWFSYLAGELYVDLSMEQLFTHNRVKTRILATLEPLVDTANLGYLFSDQVLLSHPDVDLSTEADGLFVSFRALQERRVRLVEGVREGYVEVEGTPDLVLEVVSDRSVRKDTVILARLYFQAGVLEYWLVDARGEEPRFDILRRGAKKFTPSRARNGWLHSSVLQRDFQLLKQTDPLGNPQFTLAVRG